MVNRRSKHNISTISDYHRIIICRFHAGNLHINWTFTVWNTCAAYFRHGSLPVFPDKSLYNVIVNIYIYSQTSAVWLILVPWNKTSKVSFRHIIIYRVWQWPSVTTIYESDNNGLAGRGDIPFIYVDDTMVISKFCTRFHLIMIWNFDVSSQNCDVLSPNFGIFFQHFETSCQCDNVLPKNFVDLYRKFWMLMVF